MDLFSKGDVAVEFEEYKSKLQMLRDSLNELRDYRSRRYNAACDYIRSIKTTEEKIQEQLILVQKNHSDEENDLIAQLEFVEFLAKKGIYMELTKEIIEALQSRKIVASISSAATQNQIDNAVANKDGGGTLSKVNLPKPYTQEKVVDKLNNESKDKDSYYEKFMIAYQNNDINSNCLRLKISDRYVERIDNMDFASWKNDADISKITLVQTADQPQYLAYDMANFQDKVEKDRYYYLLPINIQTNPYTLAKIKKCSMLTFFEIPIDADKAEFRFILVKPAIVEKENNEFKVMVKYKGECKL